MKPAILVISFYFPPYPRVGGRRWAKHVKHLLRQGEEVFVITGDFPGMASPWDDDIRDYTDRITRLPLQPPFRPWFETRLPETTAQKLRWKWSLLSWKLARHLKTGNYGDAALPNREAFLNAARRTIREKNVTVVILSVGPFGYADLVHNLKKEFPTLHIILDYRDPWEEAIGNLTKPQQQHELNRQKALLAQADLVLSVNDDITQHLRSLGAARAVTLPHCVDEEFLQLQLRSKEHPTGEPFHFVYGGELYGGMERQMTDFVNFFKTFKSASGHSALARFYSPYPSYEKLLDGEVEQLPMQLRENYQRILLEADFILLFKSPLSTGAFFSSKFYEMLCLRKPILFFGEAGYVSDFITEHRLGFHITQHNLEAMVTAVLNNVQSSAIPDPGYDLYQHSFEFHTRQLISLIKAM